MCELKEVNIKERVKSYENEDAKGSLSCNCILLHELVQVKYIEYVYAFIGKIHGNENLQMQSIK